MLQIILWPEELVERDGQVTYGMTVEPPGGEREALWFRLPAELRADLTQSCDPFILAMLFRAMQAKAELVVHGSVSPSLLSNLEEFQAAWRVWKPGLYSRIEILADQEIEQPRSKVSQAVSAYSGGVDSNFTVYWHRISQLAQRPFNLQAAAFVHGFDVTLRKKDDYERACLNLRGLLEGQAVKLIPIATNLRKIAGDWSDVHGIAVASALSLLQGGYDTGLIPSTDAYNHLEFPYGSNPVTDRLCSSQSFEIRHDGAAFARYEKVRLLNEWPEFRQKLRVCLVGKEKDRNCGRCEKCIRTILSFRLLDLPLPPCFERDITDAQILRVRLSSRSYLKEWSEILDLARQRGITASWTRAVRLCLSWNALRLSLKQSPWLRKTLSRS